MLDYVVLGIGINIELNPLEIPEDLVPIVGSLFCEEAPKHFKNDFIAELMTTLANEYEQFSSKDILARYRSYAMILGKEVKVLAGKDSFTALALDINDKGHLLVRLADGKVKTLNSAEVSLKML